MAAFCMVGALFQYASIEGFFEMTVPNARTLRRVLTTRVFGRHGGALGHRYLSRSVGGGDCDWLPPAKLNSTYNPPRTLLVSYPGSGKRLTWRMIESLSGFVSGDDWDLSEEGQDVATMKTSYPHPEGIWLWGDKFKEAEIILLIRNPRWAIPSYQTMRHELDYSTSWMKSFSRINDTYTVRPDVTEWEDWRGSTWPHGYKKGNADREIDRWAWFIDFWMRDGLRRNDGEGNPIQDIHCRNTTGHMDTCKPSVLISFEKLYDPTDGLAESRKLASALENGRPDMPIIEGSARDCVFSKTREKRASEERWDNTARDGNGADVMAKNFTWLQLQQMKSELERLIANYTVVPWDADPVAQDLVSNLGGYLAEVDAEIDICCSSTCPWNTDAIHDCTMPMESNDPSSLELNPISRRGHLFGAGYEQYDEVEIRKWSMDDVNNICAKKCASEDICTGFSFRYDDRYDGRTNGNCWFMTGTIKYVDGAESAGGGIWIKKSTQKNPVCTSSSFNPDPTKYYTIAVDDLVWAQGNPSTSSLGWTTKQNTPGMSMYLTNDKVGSASHWRFTQVTGNSWVTQNRLTGLKMSYDSQWHLTTNLSTETKLSATCSSSETDEVFLEMIGAHAAFPRCDINGCIFGSKLNIVERQRRETTSTGCVAYSGCGSGWTETSKTYYLFCTSYSCERYLSVPSQKIEQRWSIKEVIDFVKPDTKQAVTVTVQEHALETLSNKIALVNDIAFMNTPILGAIVGFAQSEYFSGPTIAQQLQKLADDVQEMTADMISTGIATNAIDEANKRIAHRRSYFLVEYPGHKHHYMANENMDQIDDLADDLLDKASEYAKDTTAFFGNSYSHQDMNAVKRAQKGFQYLKLALVDVLTMYREGVLLQAYAHPDDNCQNIIGRYLIPGGNSRAAAYKKQLQDTWDMLHRHRVQPIGSSLNREMYTCEAHDDFNSRTELFYFSGGGAASVYATAQQVAAAAKHELTHDMTHWSYPTHVQMDYLDGYEDGTLAMCEALRSDPEFRASFETN
uniref:Uncharacterized protein n=1 Tax=Odontella aurita TaxID=265563 RepID=A0A7S4K3E6_9STRA